MRILMIDDHALFRMGLGELLERRGIEVIAALGNCYEGIDKVAELEPDVVLLDMRMPQMNGLQVLIELRQRGAAMPIVMLTTSRDESDVVQSLQNGANGYLLKDMEPDELIEALKNILAGQTVVAPDLAMILAKALQGDLPEADSPGKSFTHLTKREKEILCLLADGQSNKLIARNLGISDGTVKLHVKSILRKLDISSRVEAAVIAVEQKLCARNID